MTIYDSTLIYNNGAEPWRAAKIGVAAPTVPVVKPTIFVNPDQIWPSGEDRRKAPPRDFLIKNLLPLATHQQVMILDIEHLNGDLAFVNLIMQISQWIRADLPTALFGYYGVVPSAPPIGGNGWFGQSAETEREFSDWVSGWLPARRWISCVVFGAYPWDHWHEQPEMQRWPRWLYDFGVQARELARFNLPVIPVLSPHAGGGLPNPAVSFPEWAAMINTALAYCGRFGIWDYDPAKERHDDGKFYVKGTDQPYAAPWVDWTRHILGKPLYYPIS